MKFTDLKPTKENLYKTFEENSIGRNKDIKLFAKLLDSLTDSCSIALDGSWGSGKTFFVKQTKLYIDSFNSHLNSMDEEEQWIFNHDDQSKDYIYKPQVTIYYDAWENDTDSDPILSLVYSIIRSVDMDYKFSMSDDSFNKAATILEFFTGKNFTEVINSLKGENPLDEIRKKKDLESDIKEFLDSLLLERGDRLVIFIDELDRCKPSFAVKLLERIKHYFSNERITFVFSINITELQHTIKSHYGNEFDACRYLDRFFDLRLTIPPVDMDKFYASIGFKDTRYTFDQVCKEVVSYFGLSLRESCRYLNVCNIAAYEPTHNSKEYNFIFDDGKATLFCLMYFIPVMIGIKLFKTRDYNSFINGTDGSPIIEVIKKMKYHYFDELLNPNETYDSDEGKNVVTLEEKIEQIYKVVFVNNENTDQFGIKIGSYSFNKNIKQLLLRIVSVLSDYMSIEGEK